MGISNNYGDYNAEEEKARLAALVESFEEDEEDNENENKT